MALKVGEVQGKRREQGQTKELEQGQEQAQAQTLAALQLAMEQLLLQRLQLQLVASLLLLQHLMGVVSLRQSTPRRRREQRPATFVLPGRE